MEVLYAIIIIVLVVVIPSIKIVPQAKSYVIERLGSYYPSCTCNGRHHIQHSTNNAQQPA